MKNIYITFIAILTAIFSFFLSYFIFYLAFLPIPIIFIIFFGRKLENKKEIFIELLIFSFLTCLFLCIFALVLDYYILKSL